MVQKSSALEDRCSLLHVLYSTGMKCYDALNGPKWDRRRKQQSLYTRRQVHACVERQLYPSGLCEQTELSGTAETDRKILTRNS